MAGEEKSKFTGGVKSRGKGKKGKKGAKANKPKADYDSEDDDEPQLTFKQK